MNTAPLKNKIRLYVNAALASDKEIALPEASSHYLCNVMRLPEGARLNCFDGASGEYEAEIIRAHKKQTLLRICCKLRDFRPSPDIWLLFAPVKKDKTDFILEKACELGVSKIIPVVTARTIVEIVRSERYQAQVIEAAEQCRRLDIPRIGSVCSLPELLRRWPTERRLFFMDETGRGQPCAQAFAAWGQSPSAVLVGPEGGFAPEEVELLYNCPFVTGISLGHRILRAETAAAAALSVWQAVAGDWYLPQGEKE